MSQGARTRALLKARQPVQISGPYLPEGDRADSIVGRVCFVIVVTALLALFVNAALGGL